MEYNILNGFYTEKEPFEHEKKREKLAAEVVKAENPDILVVCEANFGEPSDYGIIQNYKKIFKYPFIYISRHGDRSCTAVLSKFKLNFKDYSLRQRPFIRTNFKIESKNITLDVTHPHPNTIDIEKSKFFASILRDKVEPYIICGDFNALSPEDKYNIKSFTKGFRRILKEMKFEDSKIKFFINEFLKREGIRTIISNGLVDTFKVKNKKFDFTVPTDYLSKQKDTGSRIDYIFCSKEFKIIESGIIKNEKTEMASDHYPIYAILEIK